MRTYAPADVASVLAGILDEPSLARGVLHHAVEPAREAQTVPFPAWLDPRIAAALERRGIDALYTHQAEALDAVRAGRDVVRRDADRLGQEPLLRAAGPPGAGRRPVRPRPLALPDQGPRRRTRSSAFRELAAAAGLPVVCVHLRRRHAGADPVDDPHRRAGRGHQPGHAPRGDPPPPHEVVPALRAAAGHRRSTSCTPTAACSAATSPTSCGASCASAPTTARNPVIVTCSATIANPGELADAADGARAARRSTGTAPRRGERHLLFVDPPVIDAASGARGLRAHARPALGAPVHPGRPPDDRLRPLPNRASR